MARVFTTDFDFDRQTFKAIVAIRKNEHDQMSVHVRIFDKELIDILGSHVIEFRGLKGYEQLRFDNPRALRLMEVINKAIEVKL